MTQSFLVSAFMGLLHLAVPSYGLRLHRRFGTRQVGWVLVMAFLGLALLHLIGGLGGAFNASQHACARTIVSAVVPILLLIGMAHVETLFRETARVKRMQNHGRCELEQFLAGRTEELAEAKAEFHRELSRRDQQQRAAVERADRERLALGAQVAARAGQQLNRVGTAVELYAKVLRESCGGSSRTGYEACLLARAGEVRELAQKLLACGACVPVRPQLLVLGDLVRRDLPVLRGLAGRDHLLEFCSPAPSLVWADPQQVRWMLEELVRNARNAMPRGGRVTITVETVNLNQPHPGLNAAVARFCALVVTDTGCGMSRQAQRHLGEPFFTVKPGPGIGLGLASASGLMKAHGGWLEITSAPGHGTKVRLCFPRTA